MGRNWVQSLQVAAVYIGTVVGAGFATGREIVEFFTQYGFFGLVGILIAGLLFTFIGIKMMLISTRIHATSNFDLNIFLFGNTLGRIVNYLMLFVLLGVTSIMLSGAGAIFEEQLGWSRQIGVILTIIITMIVMIYGVKGLFSINLLVVPMLIVFSVIVAYQSLDIHSFQLSITKNTSPFSWIISALSYASLNLSLASAVLVPLANEVKNEKVLIKGGLIGGAILTIILLSSQIALSSLPNVTNYDVPMAEVMKKSLVTFHFIYVIVIYGEVLTTVIGNTFGLERQLTPFFKVSRMLMISFILLFAVVISQFGYSFLLTLLYPLFGKISFIILVLLVVKKIPRKKSTY
jgi:uncharacterized membrane protein YkvI